MPPARPLPEKMFAAYVSAGPEHLPTGNAYKYSPRACHSLLKRAAEHATLHLHLAHQQTNCDQLPDNGGRVVVADATVQAVRGDDIAAVRVRRHERDHQGVAQPRHEPLRARRLPPRLRHALHRALRARPRAQDLPADDAVGLPPDLRPRAAGAGHRPELLLRRPQIHLADLLLRHEQHAPRPDLRHGRAIQDGEGEPEESEVRGQSGGHAHDGGRRHAHDSLQGPRRRDGLDQAYAPPRPAAGCCRRGRRRQGLADRLHLPLHCHPRLGLALHPPGGDAQDVRCAADVDHPHLLRRDAAGHRCHLRHGAPRLRLEDRLRHEPPRRCLCWHSDIEHRLLRARAGVPDSGPGLRLGLQSPHDDHRGHNGLFHPCREYLSRRDHRVSAHRCRTLLGAVGEAQGEPGEGGRGDGDPRGDQDHRRQQRQAHGDHRAGRRATAEGPGQR